MALTYDLVCFSHVRWNFVYQRPQHLLSRYAQERRVFFIEEPIFEEAAYLAGWDVALLPFAQNEATRFISPTRTLEYLAGGKPIVSTPIRDVVQPYGQQGFVSIAETASDFIAAVKRILNEPPCRSLTTCLSLPNGVRTSIGCLLALMDNLCLSLSTSIRSIGSMD